MHMPEDVSYPGTSQHQTLLRAIIDHYQPDPRILGIAVFGSLGRGNWDQLWRHLRRDVPRLLIILVGDMLTSSRQPQRRNHR
jgi:hypothetical protein